MDDERDGTWWAIHEDDLRAMLDRVADGEDPEMVYVEHWANAVRTPD